MWKIVWGESEEFELQGTRDEIEEQLDRISPLRLDEFIDALSLSWRAEGWGETPLSVLATREWKKARLYEKVKGGWQEVIKL